MILRKYKLENGNETSSVFSVWRLDYEKVMSLCSKFQLQQHIKIGLEKQKSNVIRKIIYSGQGLQRNSAPFLIQSLEILCRTKKANLCQTLTRNFFNVYASVVQRLRIVLVSDTILTKKPPHTHTRAHTFTQTL